MKISSFPVYTHIPGQTPHPVNDPRGHSFGQHAKTSEKLGGESYRWGIELFNHGYYWEAHEAWEAAWVGEGRIGCNADFLKGLIKLAAAGVKWREQNPQGVLRHLARAEELLAAVSLLTPSGELGEISLTELLKISRSLTAGIPACPPFAEGAPVRLFLLDLPFSSGE